jgi:hypothetical protein
MTRCAAIFFALLFLAGGLRADQVEMKNGDRYAGKVISMTADTIVLQSDVLGKLTLPRGKVANINLGASQAGTAPLALSNASPDITAALRHLGAPTNFVEQVRQQFLSGAGPEANNKFDELVGGLFSGKFDMDSLRAEAKAAAGQIRELKRQGGDVGETLNAYLAILDKFLKETAHSTPAVPSVPSVPPAAPATNSAQAKR